MNTSYSLESVGKLICGGYKAINDCMRLCYQWHRCVFSLSSRMWKINPLGWFIWVSFKFGTFKEFYTFRSRWIFLKQKKKIMKFIFVIVMRHDEADIPTLWWFAVCWSTRPLHGQILTGILTMLQRVCHITRSSDKT